MLDLGDRIIGHDHPTYIIAEIGVNHDGDPLTAQRLIRAAADAGADAVKLQWFSAESLIGHDAPLAEYQRASGESSPFEMLRRLELPEHAYADLLDLAHTLGLHAVVTVFSPELVSVAARLPWNAFKVASPDLINRPLLDALTSTDAPIIISTGAARHDEIVNSLFRYGHAALHCVSAYPVPDCNAHLNGIAALRSIVRCELPPARAHLPVGYSDHTASVHTGALAVAAGACILEKHLTHDRTAPGPDHAASLDPGQFTQYVHEARRAWTTLGPRELCLQSIELDVRDASRQSLVAAADLPAGHVLQPEDFSTARPAGGISPWDAPRIYGRRLCRALPKGRRIDWTDLDFDRAPRQVNRESNQDAAA